MHACDISEELHWECLFLLDSSHPFVKKISGFCLHLLLPLRFSNLPVGCERAQLPAVPPSSTVQDLEAGLPGASETYSQSGWPRGISSTRELRRADTRVAYVCLIVFEHAGSSSVGGFPNHLDARIVPGDTPACPDGCSRKKSKRMPYDSIVHGPDTSFSVRSLFMNQLQHHLATSDNRMQSNPCS